jgi:hypothetical protein
MEFLFLEIVYEACVGKGSAFFSLQFFFQFGMLHAERGHMTVVHLILLLVRLDDLGGGVNHESLELSSPISRLVRAMPRLLVAAPHFGDDLLR